MGSASLWPLLSGAVYWPHGLSCSPWSDSWVWTCTYSRLYTGSWRTAFEEGFCWNKKILQSLLFKVNVTFKKWIQCVFRALWLQWVQRLDKYTVEYAYEILLVSQPVHQTWWQKARFVTTWQVFPQLSRICLHQRKTAVREIWEY